MSSPRLPGHSSSSPLKLSYNFVNPQFCAITNSSPTPDILPLDPMKSWDFIAKSMASAVWISVPVCFQVHIPLLSPILCITGGRASHKLPCQLAAIQVQQVESIGGTLKSDRKQEYRAFLPLLSYSGSGSGYSFSLVLIHSV